MVVFLYFEDISVKQETFVYINLSIIIVITKF